MNYLIVGNMRTGSTFLGEFLQLQGLEYYNELFTPEICRRSRIWPEEHDEYINAEVIKTAFSRPRAGFKMIYGQATKQTWLRLAMVHNLRVIHLVRSDHIEQFASIKYLENAGVSLARRCGEEIECWGTDGKKTTAGEILLSLDPEEYKSFLARNAEWRDRVRWLFGSGDFLELEFRQVFTDTGQMAVLDFLGLPTGSYSIPNHVPTPRPKARDLFENYSEVSDFLFDTPYEIPFAKD